jgi:hypothetical protein
MADNVSTTADTIEPAGFHAGDCTILWGHLRVDPINALAYRLYLSIQLNEYLSILQGDVVAQVDLFSADQPLAGSLVWLQKGTPIARVLEETADQEGDLLKGAITRGFLSGFQAGSILGLADVTKKSIDPTSGGGCGTGAAFGCT